MPCMQSRCSTTGFTATAVTFSYAVFAEKHRRNAKIAGRRVVRIYSEELSEMSVETRKSVSVCSPDPGRTQTGFSSIVQGNPGTEIDPCRCRAECRRDHSFCISSGSCSESLRRRNLRKLSWGLVEHKHSLASRSTIGGESLEVGLCSTENRKNYSNRGPHGTHFVNLRHSKRGQWCPR